MLKNTDLTFGIECCIGCVFSRQSRVVFLKKLELRSEVEFEQDFVLEHCSIVLLFSDDVV